MTFFFSFFKYFGESRRLKTEFNKAETFYNQKTIRILFDNWRVYSQDFHLKSLKANSCFDDKMKDLKLRYFNEWREFTQESKDENYKERVAVTFHLKILLSTVFRSWNTYTTNRGLKHFNDKNKIEEFQKKIQIKLIFKIYYEKWKFKKDQKILENYSVELSVNHYNKKIEKNVLNHWIVFTKLAKKKKLLEKQADWFNKMRLNCFAFQVWQQKYALIAQENEKNNKSIIHWAWQLEKKCFVNWLMYVNNRKMKKNRYSEAMNDRRNEILKNIVKSFIIYSNDSRDRRFKQLVNQKQQKLTIDNQLELKYYHRWRENFKRKRQAKSKLNSLFNKVDEFERRIPDKQTPILSFTDLPSMRILNRPQPRKPAFLLDSIIQDQAVNIETNSKSNESVLNISSTVPTIEVLNTIATASENKVTKPVLLPPSAFTTVLPETKILIFENQSRCTSATTTFDTEMHQEMTLLKLNDQNLIKKSEENYNLMRLKERLENLSMKKEKLK